MVTAIFFVLRTVVPWRDLPRQFGPWSSVYARFRRWWEAVLYSVSLDKNLSQKNLRACRVVGETWADIHLSITSASSTWKDLEDVVSGLSLVPNPPAKGN
jgi:hypothetical protein